MLSMFVVFFVKQKTAYEMRISDWSSDVCSSDLRSCKTHVRFAVFTSPFAEGGSAWCRRVGFARLGTRRRSTRWIYSTRLRRSIGSRHFSDDQIGRASCRERVRQYG